MRVKQTDAGRQIPLLSEFPGIMLQKVYVFTCSIGTWVYILTTGFKYQPKKFGVVTLPPVLEVLPYQGQQKRRAHAKWREHFTYLLAPF
ncbi:hypothetical protein D0X99_19755 [Algoriphagus lacus]|uniref:Uncharacterized protein n=1 Tax=Algoriphagus lacus TaxID=2056311 RepID=A0A418PLI0_9BACT|nr:hypothetical protein D0X99_19755 [Algoriphagus lacus]